jgi:hypothetical protein
VVEPKRYLYWLWPLITYCYFTSVVFLMEESKLYYEIEFLFGLETHFKAEVYYKASLRAQTNVMYCD